MKNVTSLLLLCSRFVCGRLCHIGRDGLKVSVSYGGIDKQLEIVGKCKPEAEDGVCKRPCESLLPSLSVDGRSKPLQQKNGDIYIL